MNKPPLKKEKLIIMDFDGTIADSFLTVLTTFNEVADKYGLKKISHDDAQRYKDLSPLELLQEIKASKWKIPFIARDVKKRLIGKISNIKPFKGIGESISQLKKENFLIGIITSNSKDNVQCFLDNNHLDYFDFVQSASNIFGKDRIFKKILKEYGYPASQTISIGDEVRDVEAAKRAGITSLAVTWGFNTRQALVKCQPDYIIDNPEELPSVVSRI